MNAVKVLSIIVFIVFHSQLQARDFPFIHHTIADGLPSNTIYEVYKDSKGFLWFPSDKGVARYNGLRYEVFTTFDGLADNEVFFCQEDHQGRIWFACYNGQLCYYKDGKFYNPENDPNLKLGFNSPFIKMIVVEKDSSITFAFQKNAHIVNIKKNKLSTYQLPHMPGEDYYITNVNKINDTLYNIYADRYNKYIFNTRQNTIRLQDRQFKDALFLFGQNQKYYLHSNKIYKQDGSLAGTYSDKTVQDNTVYRVLLNNAGIFLGTRKGLYLNDSIELLPNKKISSIIQDNQGNYWISTLENGIFVMKSDFRTTSVQRNVYTGKVIYASKIADKIIFGTSDNKVYEADSVTTHIRFDFSNYEKEDKEETDDEVFIHGANYSLYNIFYNRVVYIPDVRKPGYKTYLNQTFVRAIRSGQYADGYIFVKRGNYILRMCAPTGSGKIDFTQIHTVNKNSERLFDIKTGFDNYLWYSTILGIYRLNSDTSTTFIGRPGLKTFCFAGSRIVGITHFNNLVICRVAQNRITTDTVPSQNCIWDKLHVVDSSTIIIETNNNYRILKIAANGTFTVYTVENRFVPTHPEQIYADNKNCYFFKDGNITSISMSGVYRQALPPGLLFNKLKTKGHEYSIDDTMKISYDESRELSISFQTLSSGGKSVQYQYAITQNNEVKWRELNGDINLTYPQYGIYSVFIRAKTLSSHFSVPIGFTLVIKKPWWMSFYFITFSLISIGLSIWVSVRLRVKYLIRKKEKTHHDEVRFIRSEYKALNALMNPHFIFNTLNDVQDLINKNDKRAANEYLRTFADLIRQNMHNVAKEMIPLQKEIDLVKNYLILEKLRFEEKLEFEILIDEMVNLDDVYVPPLLIQPLVENSIKHGIFPLVNRTGTIKVTVTETDNSILISVYDNGLGLDAAAGKIRDAHEPFGLENIRNRISKLSMLLGRDIQLKFSSVNEGNIAWTVATVSIQF